MDYITTVGRTVETAEMDDILTFIQDYVDDRKAASTIRSVYAALLFHFRLRGCDSVLRNPIVLMFVKGAQRLAPAPRQKTAIWNPEIPLSFLSSCPRPSEFRPAAREALLLLLLATGIRVDCASKMAAKVTMRENFCQIPFLLPRKTGHSEPQRIRRYPNNERVCPVKAVEHFLSLAREVRKNDDQFLFISSKGSRAHIDTLRHWVIELLSETGIQTSAGSCRSASASAALANDEPIDSILKSAGWTRESTFRRYYHREVLSADEGLILF